MNKNERVTFSPVGTESDCYTHTVLRLSASSSSSSSKIRNRAAPASSTWLLRTGDGSLASDLSARLHVDKAAMNVFLKSVVAAQGAVTPYLINKTTSPPEASVNPPSTASPGTAGDLPPSVLSPQSCLPRSVIRHNSTCTSRQLLARALL